MSKADVVAVILWRRATLYAIFGGADFGAGFWELLARRSPRRAPCARGSTRIRSLGPVWEANHVWLIFVLVVLWTAFPKAFGGDHGDALSCRSALAAFGIVLRGSGFAFGHAFVGAGAAHVRACSRCRP